MDSDPRKSRRRRIWRIVRTTGALVGLAFVAFALVDTWRRTDRAAVTWWPWIILAGAVYLVALLCFARCWAVLFEDQGTPGLLRHSFFAGQLGKYVPGAVWQAVGQVALARDAGVGVARASAIYPIFMLCIAVAGASTSTLVILLKPAVPGLRYVAPAGLLFLLLLRRGWMVRVLARVRRLVRSADVDVEVPSQRTIIVAYGWSVAALVLLGGTYAALIVPPSGVSVSVFQAVVAFAAAWTVGFVAVPFPSGLGVREAALLALMPASSEVAVVLSASLILRGVGIAVEVVVAAVSVGVKRTRNLTPPEDNEAVAGDD